MNIFKFFHYNDMCPVCGEPLQLYMQVTDSALWKAHFVSPLEYEFTQFKCIDDKLEDDTLSLVDQESSCLFSVNGNYLKRKLQSNNFFFFFMCNEDGIKDHRKDDFTLDPYVGCYYRSSNYMEMVKKEDKIWAFELSGDQDPDRIMRNEIMTFKRLQTDGVEKVYILNLDYEADQTVFSFYATTAEQRSQDNFEPKFLRKELPLLNTRPNFDMMSRDKLLDRFDAWVLMS